MSDKPSLFDPMPETLRVIFSDDWIIRLEKDSSVLYEAKNRKDAIEWCFLNGAWLVHRIENANYTSLIEIKE